MHTSLRQPFGRTADVIDNLVNIEIFWNLLVFGGLQPLILQCYFKNVMLYYWTIFLANWVILSNFRHQPNSRAEWSTANKFATCSHYFYWKPNKTRKPRCRRKGTSDCYDLHRNYLQRVFVRNIAISHSLLLRSINCFQICLRCRSLKRGFKIQPYWPDLRRGEFESAALCIEQSPLLMVQEYPGLFSWFKLIWTCSALTLYGVKCGSKHHPIKIITHGINRKLSTR